MSERSGPDSGDWPLRPQSEIDTDDLFTVQSLAAERPVIPMSSRENYKEVFLLCRETGRLAVQGMCPVHESDACMSVYVRYNRVFETMEKNFKDAMVKTRCEVAG